MRRNPVHLVKQGAWCIDGHQARNSARHSECNEAGVQTTSDIDEVECGRCKRTKSYRKSRAIRNEIKQEIKDLLEDKI